MWNVSSNWYCTAKTIKSVCFILNLLLLFPFSYQCSSIFVHDLLLSMIKWVIKTEKKLTDKYVLTFNIIVNWQ